MKIAKGITSIHEDDLLKMFVLPEEVSIFDISLDEEGYVNIILASPEPIKRITHPHQNNESCGLYRRTRLIPRSQDNEGEYNGKLRSE